MKKTPRNNKTKYQMKGRWLINEITKGNIKLKQKIKEILNEQ